ncbi:SUKH-4 family immunity protein [Streptomyces sp. NPDC005907]|uniref:SUKH-4 family immunity protein n=1 Tax=Streptomyces sp. NPDC005907 TaxID=3154571 RepID=UPI0033E13377
MVTFAQAQERAEEWINGDVASYQHREVRVREFDLGFVVWAEDRADGPRSDGGAQRLVIARDSGEATLWPALPVGEVVRRYEEEYGVSDVPAGPVPAARVDLNQTSFLLSPPEWLQEAADRMGIPDRRAGESDGAGSRPPAAGVSGDGASAGGGPGGAGVSDGEGVRVSSGSSGAGVAAAPEGATAWPAAASDDEVREAPPQDRAPSGVPAGATPWAGTDTNGDGGEDRSVPLPATVFAPPLSDFDEVAPPPAVTPDAKTALMSGGSALPRTTLAPALDDPGTPSPSRSPQDAGAPGSGGVPSGSVPAGSAYGCPQGPGGPGTPVSGIPGTPPPGAPGAPGTAGAAVPGGPGTPPPGTPPPGATAPGAPGVPAPGAHAPGGPGTPPPGVPVPGGPQGTPPPGAPSYGYPQGPGGPGAPQPPAGPASAGRPLPPNAGDIADAATSKAQRPARGARGGGAATPPPPGAPGMPGARPGSTPPPGPGAPGAPAGGYVPTQLMSQLGPDGPEGLPGAGAPSAPQAPGTPGGTPAGDAHHAATMLAGPAVGGPGAPPPPSPPGAPHAPGAPNPPGGTPAGDAHHAATMLAGPAVGGPRPPGAPGVPGAPATPGAPGVPGTPGAVHHAATMLAGPAVGGPAAPPPPQAPGMPPGGPRPMPGHPMPGGPVPGQPMPGQPPAYGYPQGGQPTVGPGYQAVLRYRAQDGSEQQLIRRSAPGTPHPEWQILHELRAMNVPPQQVLELHTELESCELPGAYCARMIRETWPQARITSIAPYGTDHASRQQGMHQLLAHQGELHQVADGPARPAPVRAPIPPVQPAPPVPPEGVAHELAAAFGPGVLRFDHAAVSRQGVPPIVAHTLVVAGLPVDMGPFFWAQAQPGRPVPTLAELAQERGVQPAPDAGSYLVMGTDFGRAVCVQYGTANIVAVPVEAGPGGGSVPPQFVNTGLPEFARCLALLGRMWRLRYGLNQEQAGRWTVDFQAQLAALDPAALGSPESWWSVLLEQMWDGLL